MSELSLPEKVLLIDDGLTRARIEHAFGGALALAYYAEPRVTIDVDVNAFIPPGKADLAAAGLSALGVETKATEQDGQVRWWWGRTPIDVFFSNDPIHEAMRRHVRRVRFGAALIPILSPEHLLVCKLAFDRPKDWIDIEQMALGTDLDRGEIDRWVERIASAGDPRRKRLDQILARNG